MKFLGLLITLITPILGASLEGRVVGGEQAELGDVPSIVSLRDPDGSHMCGGVLISSDWVLTAGHCASVSHAIQYGKLVISPSPGDNSVIRVADAITHEDFDFPENDIALLKLAEPATFSKFVKPAVLPEQDEPAPGGNNALLAGWGYTGSFGILPDDLLKVNITVVDQKECQDLFGSGIYEYNLCAGVPEGEKGQCSGDSGGPLTVDGKVVGLVSWSAKPCTMAPLPGVYTRVASFRDWIREKTGI